MEKDAGAAFVRAGAGMPDGHAKGRGLNIEAAESCYKQQCIVPACVVPILVAGGGVVGLLLTDGLLEVFYGLAKPAADFRQFFGAKQ